MVKPSKPRLSATANGPAATADVGLAVPTASVESVEPPKKVDMAAAGVNVEWYVRLQKAKDEIQADADLVNLVSAPPLTIANGGSIAPYDADDYKTSMKQNGKYTCGFNFWWLLHEFNTAPSVPILDDTVEDMGKRKLWVDFRS